MPRVKVTTTLDEELYIKSREAAAGLGLEGANAIIEKALRLYFANCATEVWEKELESGWVKKLVMRQGKVTFESIRSRKVLPRYNSKYYTPEALELKGWRRVWKMKMA
jgi:hypothetical protein